MYERKRELYTVYKKGLKKYSYHDIILTKKNNYRSIDVIVDRNVRNKSLKQLVSDKI